MTDAEQRLWRELRAHRFNSFSFRRQVPIGSYIVDFLCLEARLIVEVDGGRHNQNRRDQIRDAWLTRQGFAILRFWNNDVFSNANGVRERIADALRLTVPPSPTLPRKGGGSALRREARNG